MKTRNFSLAMDGDWQTLPIPESSFMGLQIENPSGNDVVEYRWTESGAVRTIAAGETYDVVTPKPNDEPIRNEIQVKGTNTQIITGEYWLYNRGNL